MPWTPDFDFVPVSAFIKNVRAVIERDAPAALPYIASRWLPAGETLPPFADYHTARQAAENYPVCNLLPLGGDPETDDDGARSDETHRILIEAETAGDDADALMTSLTCYTIAFRSILTRMTAADLVTGIQGASRSVPVWTIGSERYGERLYESENLYTQIGSVVLTINYLEGKING